MRSPRTPDSALPQAGGVAPGAGIRCTDFVGRFGCRRRGSPCRRRTALVDRGILIGETIYAGMDLVASRDDMSQDVRVQSADANSAPVVIGKEAATAPRARSQAREGSWPDKGAQRRTPYCGFSHQSAVEAVRPVGGEGYWRTADPPIEPSRSPGNIRSGYFSWPVHLNASRHWQRNLAFQHARGEYFYLPWRHGAGPGISRHGHCSLEANPDTVASADGCAK